MRALAGCGQTGKLYLPESTQGEVVTRPTQTPPPESGTTSNSPQPVDSPPAPDTPAPEVAEPGKEGTGKEGPGKEGKKKNGADGAPPETPRKN